MATQSNIPIPQNPIGENYAWRDWFQKLSNRVFGTLANQDSSSVVITGGTINGTSIGAATPSTGKFTTLDATTTRTNNLLVDSGTDGQILVGRTSDHAFLPATLGAGTGVSVTSGAGSLSVGLANNYGDSLNPYASKTANYFLGAPNGSAGVPTFRALVVADVTGLGTMATQNTGISTTVALAKLTVVGTNGSLTVSNGIITAYTAPT